jgi:hypothetical protein
MGRAYAWKGTEKMRKIIVIATVLSLIVLAEGCSSASSVEQQIEYEGEAKTWEGDNVFDKNTSVDEVVSDEAFGNFGRLIFPVEQWYYSGDTLGNLRLTWYYPCNADTTVEVVNRLRNDALSGKQIFYDIYTDEEKAGDPEKNDTGLFYLRGNQGAKFAICNAGGGFAYVGAMKDSFPHALELSKHGYNGFVLITDQMHSRLVRIWLER